MLARIKVSARRPRKRMRYQLTQRLLAPSRGKPQRKVQCRRATLPRQWLRKNPLQRKSQRSPQPLLKRQNSVQAILAAVPSFTTGQWLTLGEVAKVLHDVKLLAKSATSTKLFKKFPQHFELSPTGKTQSGQIYFVGSEVIALQGAYLVQFSTSRPFTLPKSLTLFVTTMAPIARACAAIMRSAAPSCPPRFFQVCANLSVVFSPAPLRASPERPGARPNYRELPGSVLRLAAAEACTPYVSSAKVTADITCWRRGTDCTLVANVWDSARMRKMHVSVSSMNSGSVKTSAPESACVRYLP
jgi:hypothetical protein